MGRLTRDDVVRAIGPADDVTIAEIIGTDATREELAEAKAWIANDEPLMNDGRPLAQGRVRQLVDILADLESSETDDETRPAVI
jgi:hypothetical protein